MLNYGWQIDAELWGQIPEDLLLSTSWRHVSFTLSEAAGLPKDPGIYCICASPVGRQQPEETTPNDLFGRLFTPIYIGRTDNLKRRFDEHCKRPSVKVEAAKKCFGACLQFWFHRLPLERIADEEAKLIKCFGPTANEREERIKAKVGAGIPIGIQS